MDKDITRHSAGEMFYSEVWRVTAMRSLETSAFAVTFVLNHARVVLVTKASTVHFV